MRIIFFEIPLDIKLVLLRVLVNLLSHDLHLGIHVRVVQELYLLKHLEPTDCDIVELVDADHVLGRLVVESNVAVRLEHRSIQSGLLLRVHNHGH